MGFQKSETHFASMISIVSSVRFTKMTKSKEVIEWKQE